MADYEFVKTEVEGNILKVTMNRPEVYNAIHIHMHQEMDKVWNDFAANPDLWVAVLTGAGEKAFSAGNDLKATAQGITGEMPASGFAGLANRLDREKPIVGAVNGFAMGGGMETAISCDVLIAADTATFALAGSEGWLLRGRWRRSETFPSDRPQSCDRDDAVRPQGWRC